MTDYNLYNPEQSVQDQIKAIVAKLGSIEDLVREYQSPVESTDSHAGYMRRASDRWYIAGAPYGINTNTTVTPPTGVLQFLPLLIDDPVDIDEVGVWMVTLASAGDKARMGIYDTGDRKALKPGRLLRDFGEFAIDGSTGLRSTTVSPRFTIHRGLYWLAFTPKQDVLANMRGIAGADRWGILGHPASDWTLAGYSWSQTFTYGALPESYTGSTISGANSPALGIRPAN